MRSTRSCSTRYGCLKIHTATPCTPSFLTHWTPSPSPALAFPCQRLPLPPPSPALASPCPRLLLRLHADPAAAGMRRGTVAGAAGRVRRAGRRRPGMNRGAGRNNFFRGFIRCSRGGRALLDSRRLLHPRGSRVPVAVARCGQSESCHSCRAGSLRSLQHLHPNVNTFVSIEGSFSIPARRRSCRLPVAR